MKLNNTESLRKTLLEKQKKLPGHSLFNPFLWLILIFAFYNLFTLPHYGMTWDESVHLSSGLINVQKLMGVQVNWLPETAAYGPVGETLGALSYLIFFVKLHWLPFDVAFHLPVVLFGILGVYVAYLLGRDFFGKRVGLWAAFFLAILPRFVGHLHNDIKDIPLATLFALGVYLFSKYFLTRQKIYLFWGAFFSGLALAQKITALEIFPIILLSAFLTSFSIKRNGLSIKYKPLIFLLISFCLALGFAFIFWPRLWGNPVWEIQNIYGHFSTAWKGNSVPYFGKAYNAGINVPWHYALGFLAITTPIYILVLAALGVIKSICVLILRPPIKIGERSFKNSPLSTERDSNNKIFIYLVLLVWFFLPTLKYLIPSTIIYDDIRQYIEVIFPLVIFAGIGIDDFLNRVFRFINYLFFEPRVKSGREVLKIVLDRFHLTRTIREFFVTTFFLLLFLGHFIYVEKNYHPYETSYFNYLVGGLHGAANQSFDPDFWANPLKEASQWVNQHAPQNSSVNTPLAEKIGSLYLRPDLKEENGKEDIFKADYVMLLNRPSVFWLNSNVYYYISAHQPVYTIQRDNTPLIYIYQK